jgi:hypothetical protein
MHAKNYRRWFLILGSSFLFSSLIPLLSILNPQSSFLLAQETAVEKDTTPWPSRVHPWGDFQPGAWKLVRITTENFNDQCALISTNVCDNKTTLAKRDADSVTLEVKTDAELSGRRLDGPTHTICQGLHGEVLGPTMRVKEPTPSEVEVDNQKIPCLVRQVESTGSANKTVSTLYYSQNVAPYLLKRLSTTTDRRSNQVLSETTTTVLFFDMPLKFQGTLLSVTYVRTVQKTPQGSTFTLAAVCPAIPGGIVNHTSKELDPKGRLIRRSTLELLDYGIEPEPDHPGYINRRRPGRHRGN